MVVKPRRRVASVTAGKVALLACSASAVVVDKGIDIARVREV